MGENDGKSLELIGLLESQGSTLAGFKLLL